MKFGVVLLSEHPSGRDPTDCLEGIRSQARLVENLGFDSLWITERHFTEDVYFDNFQLLSHIAAVTDGITIGTGVCVVPLYNPARLAERTANLDVLSDGRFVFGAGLGNPHEAYEILGVDRKRRARRMEEVLELLRRLWVEDGVNYDGEEFTVSNVSVNPKPVQPGGPDVWIGGSAEPAVRRAARMGDAWFASSLDSMADLDGADRAYREELAAVGRAPSARPVFREVFVDESYEAATDRVRPYLTEKYAGYLERHSVESEGPGFTVEEFDELASDRFLLGSPGRVVEEIERYRERFDVDHLVIRTQWPGMDGEATERSLRLFAQEVLPAFE